MANRSYLFAIDFDRTKEERKKGDKIFGLSEYPYSIPLSYKILISQDTKISNSINWDYEHPIAIQGDFEKGKQKLLDFLTKLEKEELFDNAELEKQINETRDFLNSHQLKNIILECGEIYQMGCEKLEEQNQELFNDILNIESQIKQYLKDFREMNKNKTEDTEQEMWNMLGINYWSEVLYYHFDNE